MSSENTLRFRQLLADNNQHVTKAREATFNLLISPEPQTMRQILEKSGGTVDRVTVYRNIELFEKLGIVHRIYVGWKYKIELSEDFIAHHHHLSCLQCGRIIDIEDEAHVDEFIQDLARRFAFTPRRHQFEVDGYCKDCAPS